jgi:hypothetical protein
LEFTVGITVNTKFRRVVDLQLGFNSQSNPRLKPESATDSPWRSQIWPAVQSETAGKFRVGCQTLLEDIHHFFDPVSLSLDVSRHVNLSVLEGFCLSVFA